MKDSNTTSFLYDSTHIDNYSDELDEFENYHFHSRIVEHYRPEAIFAWKETSKLVIKTPSLDAAVAAVMRVVSLADGKAEPQGLIITGEVGTGKSQVIKVARHILRSKEILLANDKTLFAESRLKARPTRYGLIRDLLQLFDHPLFHTNQKRATADIKFKILRHIIRASGCLTVVIEEAQNLFTTPYKSNTDLSGGNEVTDALRALMDEAKIPVILVGTDALRNLSSIDPGLASRVRTSVVMPVLDDDTWAIMLNGYNKAIKKYCDPSILKEKSVQLEIQNFSKGQQRQLKRLMAELVLLCLDKKSASITAKIFDLAIQNLREDGAPI